MESVNRNMKDAERSFSKLFESNLKQLSASLSHIFMGMRSVYASAQEGKDMMEYELTPERFMEIGKRFEDAFLAYLPIEKRLKGLKLEDILGSSSDEEIIAYINKRGKKGKAARGKGNG